MKHREHRRTPALLPASKPPHSSASRKSAGPLLTAAFAVLAGCTSAQERETPPADPAVAEAMPVLIADPADVESADAIVGAVYDVISGPGGAPRDWDRFRSLFLPGARLIPSGAGQDGRVGARVMSPDDYASLAQSGNWFAEGFFEAETSHVSERYGNIAHRFSTYAAYRSESDAEPFMRGINSIQLLDDGERWWVVTIFWQSESDGGPIPDRYTENR